MGTAVERTSHKLVLFSSTLQGSSSGSALSHCGRISPSVNATIFAKDCPRMKKGWMFANQLFGTVSKV